MPSPEVIAQTAGAIALAFIAVAFAVQRLLKGWKETSTEGSILSMMHEELTRMSAQNTTLSNELNKLQIEIVTLNKELYKLTLENQNLHQQVVNLTSEVSRLQSVLNQSGTSNANTGQI